MATPYTFAILGMISNTVFAWPFIVGMWRKNISLHPYSWLIWILVGGINAYGLYSQGNLIAFVAQTYGMMFWFFYCAYGFIHEEKIKLNWIDSICLFGGIVAVLMLLVFGLAEAIIAIVIVDVIAIVPTWKKIYYHPENDRAFPWFGSVSTLILYLLSVQNISFESTVFWIYLLTVNMGTGIYIVLRRKQLGK